MSGVREWLFCLIIKESDMNKRHILGGIFLLLLVSSLCVGQTTDMTSNRIKLQLQKVRVSAVLAALAVQSEVSIGFERSDTLHLSL